MAENANDTQAFAATQAFAVTDNEANEVGVSGQTTSAANHTVDFESTQAFPFDATQPIDYNNLGNSDSFCATQQFAVPSVPAHDESFTRPEPRPNLREEEHGVCDMTLPFDVNPLEVADVNQTQPFDVADTLSYHAVAATAGGAAFGEDDRTHASTDVDTQPVFAATQAFPLSEELSYDPTDDSEAPTASSLQGAAAPESPPPDEGEEDSPGTHDLSDPLEDTATPGRDARGHPLAAVDGVGQREVDTSPPSGGTDGGVGQREADTCPLEEEEDRAAAVVSSPTPSSSDGGSGEASPKEGREAAYGGGAGDEITPESPPQSPTESMEQIQPSDTTVPVTNAAENSDDDDSPQSPLAEAEESATFAFEAPEGDTTGSPPASPAAAEGGEEATPGVSSPAGAQPPSEPPASPHSERADELEGPASPPNSPTSEPPQSPDQDEDENAIGGVPIRMGSDEDNDEEDLVQPKRIADGSGDEREEEEDDVNRSASKKRKRVILDSDDEDTELPEDRPKSRDESDKGEESDKEKGDSQVIKERAVIASDDEDEEDKKSEVGELIADIFGESDAEKESGDEDDNQAEGAEPTPGDGEGQTTEETQNDMDPVNLRETTEWDFDLMLARKKAEGRSKRSRRKRDGTYDLTSDADEQIKELVADMRAAAKDDRLSNTERKLAIQKRKMLPFVLGQLKKADLREALVDLGIMSAISDWLTPLPDKSLPALEIRTEFLKILLTFTKLDHSILRTSHIGKSVMLLLKHPKETKDNKARASKIISEWARPIFNLETDYRTLSKEERQQRDYEHMPTAKRKRLSQDGEPGAGGGGAKRPGDDEDGAAPTLRPGDRGWVGRARVPRPSTKDYIVRPKSTVEGFKADFKGGGAKKTQYEKKLREFNDKVKRTKSLRAVQISISGNKMD